jgi:hypothetical protein
VAILVNLNVLDCSVGFRNFVSVGEVKMSGSEPICARDIPASGGVMFTVT